jgi:hypothetical protein
MEITMLLDEVPGECVAGFDLCGWRQPDGSIKSHCGKSMLMALPDNVKYAGNTYTLEQVDEGQVDPEKGQWINALYA